MRLRIEDLEPIDYLRRPLREFFRSNFPNTTTEVLQEQATERLLSHLRPHLQNLLTPFEGSIGRNGSRIDICATVEVLLRPCVKGVLRILFDNGL